MASIFFKEINSFFSSLTGYIVIAVFLVITGLFLWVFGDTSIFNYNFASLGQLFAIAPSVFLFLIPSITMGSFSGETQAGTMEFLLTKPLSSADVLLGKFAASWVLVLCAILPTLIYYYSIYQLGSPVGNIDTGQVFGSYVGLIMLSGSLTSVGIFASSLTQNQIIAFLMAALMSFFMFWGFDFISTLPIFMGKSDAFVQYIGLLEHYENISKGRIDLKDLIYFISFICFFLWGTFISINKDKFAGQ